MKVWELVPRSSVPKEHNVIACKWVFKVKTDSSGAVDRYKARITPKGFQQREGINFFETFAATGKYKSLRLGLMLTAACGHILEQLDVPQAFLNAGIEEQASGTGGMARVLGWLTHPFDLIVGAGLLGFGMFSLVEARFRRLHDVPIDAVTRRLG